MPSWPERCAPAEPSSWSRTAVVIGSPIRDDDARPVSGSRGHVASPAPHLPWPTGTSGTPASQREIRRALVDRNDLRPETPRALGKDDERLARVEDLERALQRPRGQAVPGGSETRREAPRGARPRGSSRPRLSRCSAASCARPSQRRASPRTTGGSRHDERTSRRTWSFPITPPTNTTREAADRGSLGRCRRTKRLAAGDRRTWRERV